MLYKYGYEFIVCSGMKIYWFLFEKMIDGVIILDVNFLFSEIINYVNCGYKLVVFDCEFIYENVS